MTLRASSFIPSAGEGEAKPYHAALARGLALIAEHVLAIEKLRRLADRAGETGFISDAKVGKRIEVAGERFSPAIMPKTSDPRWGKATVRYSELAVAAIMTMFEADARMGGTGRGVARKVEGIRRRCMEIAVMPFFGGDARGEVGKGIHMFPFEDVVVMCWCGESRANVLAVIRKEDDYRSALSEEDNQALATTLVWLRLAVHDW